MTKGRQFHNQDEGYGLCPSCYDYILKKEGLKYVEENYGKLGEHILREVPKEVS